MNHVHNTYKIRLDICITGVASYFSHLGLIFWCPLRTAFVPKYNRLIIGFCLFPLLSYHNVRSIYKHAVLEVLHLLEYFNLSASFVCHYFLNGKHQVAGS